LTVGGVTRPRRAHEEATAPPVCLVVVIVIVIVIIIIVIVVAAFVVIVVVVVTNKTALATGLDGLGRYSRTNNRCGKQNHRKTGEQCHKS
jgi:flagellar basal body-associated protein FliL